MWISKVSASSHIRFYENKTKSRAVRKSPSLQVGVKSSYLGWIGSRQSQKDGPDNPGWLRARLPPFYSPQQDLKGFPKPLTSSFGFWLLPVFTRALFGNSQQGGCCRSHPEHISVKGTLSLTQPNWVYQEWRKLECGILVPLPLCLGWV